MLIHPPLTGTIRNDNFFVACFPPEFYVGNSLSCTVFFNVCLLVSLKQNNKEAQKKAERNKNQHSKGKAQIILKDKISGE